MEGNLVEPHGKCTVAFSLAWSSPKVKFSKGITFHRYKFTLFNELYFLVAGGTIWIDSPLPSSNMRNKSQDQIKELENTEVKVTEAKVSRRQGADAGRTTDSTYDFETCMQSREIWTGVTYGCCFYDDPCRNGRGGIRNCRGYISSRLVRRWIRVLVSDTRGMDNGWTLQILVSDTKGMDNGWTLQVSHLHEATFNLGFAICINIAQDNS
ncbi:hypothetical protein Ahy_A05g025662 [Arachis hypogaea]|uniref:Uncharacterized protein n=1 Tax=Arachis hypogaea TaxID=3818 RepID=A0A445D983_ARAHY|nr:hypothetical protein Ahy_A05g025662 [Arachis hypogaea]